MPLVVFRCLSTIRLMPSFASPTAAGTPPGPIRGISSMATRQVLADLVSAYEQRSGARVLIESVGGVDAAKRVMADEAFDLVVLASDAIDKLLAAGKLLPRSQRGLRSGE